ncbi:hypothetical protein GGR57DRAFT_285321 [Xylariaceae sp. FL1272]|nr:hypothetical protein GGR57DRAFT_285321 [Xylariaceae sp. FL1272]
MATGSDTSSDLELQPIDLPPTCKWRTPGPRSKRFILCLGSFAGDFWHCAAATVLSHYQRTDTIAKRPFRDSEFIVCIVIAVDEANVPGDEWIKGARKMFTYFRSIGVPCMVITTPRVTQKSDHTIAKLSDSEIRACWEDQDNEPEAKSVDEVFSLKRKTAVSHESDVENSECILRHEAGTSVLLQLAQHFGQETTCAILAYRLSGADKLAKLGEKRVDHVELRVQERIRGLDEIISETASFAGKKKLLFNYRYTDYNPQHDGSRGILEQVKELARKEKTVVIVLPAMEERFLQREIKPDDKVFYLYEKPEGEKQYETGGGLSYVARARFWVRVAQRAKDWKLIGMIGGRSGSMDIPAFVGLRCLSWDEPIFQVKEARKDGSKWVIPIPRPAKESKDEVEVQSSDEEIKPKVTGKGKRTRPDTAVKKPSKKKSTIPPSPWATSHWTEQGHQSLRLLNQIGLMHVTFSKRSAVTQYQRGGSWQRRYTALEEQDPRLIHFLNDPRNPPMASLGFEPVKGWSEWVVKKYRGKLESANIGVTAIYLQRYIDLATAIGTAQVDEAQEDDSSDREEDKSSEESSSSDNSDDSANSYDSSP